MKNKSLKTIGAISLIALLVGSTFMSYATSIDANVQNFQNGQEMQKPENEITGKITYIDATNVIISVATRKEMEKPQGEQGGTPPEKPQGEQGGTPPEKPSGDMNNGNPPEKQNLDEMFTLTGESKTINIANADFGNKHNKEANGQTETTETKKTYADYSIGDYINIEATDSTYAVAKVVRDAHGMGGRREFGNPPQQISNSQ